jgi:hypothetical protein
MALIFICDTHHKKLERVRSGQFFGCSQKVYFGLMSGVLFITAFFIGFSMAVIPPAIPFFLVILVVYTCQAIFYRKYVTLFTAYYSEAGLLNDPHHPAYTPQVVGNNITPMD